MIGATPLGGAPMAAGAAVAPSTPGVIALVGIGSTGRATSGVGNISVTDTTSFPRYPAFPVTRDSEFEIEDGYDHERSSNGTLKIRVLFPGPKANFRIKHVLTSAERNVLDVFYSTNKLGTVSFRWPEDSVIYNCRFVASPVYRRVGTRFEARIRLREV